MKGFDGWGGCGCIFIIQEFEHLRIQHEVVLGLIGLVVFRMTRNVSAVLIHERGKEGAGAVLLKALIHRRRGMRHQHGIGEGCRAMVSRVSGGLNRSVNGLEAWNEPDHGLLLDGFGFERRHPLGFNLSQRGCGFRALLNGEEALEGLGCLKGVGKKGCGEHIVPPRLAALGFDGLYLGSHLGHRVVVGEMMEHETQPVQRPFIAVEHVRVAR